MCAKSVKNHKIEKKSGSVKKIGVTLFQQGFSMKKINSSDKTLTGIIRILRISSVHFSSLNVYDQLTKKITALLNIHKMIGNLYKILGHSYNILGRSYKIIGQSHGILGQSYTILGISYAIRGISVHIPRKILQDLRNFL